MRKAYVCTNCGGAGAIRDNDGEEWMCAPCDGSGEVWLWDDDVEGRMARHGFMVEETGGGCTAYVRRDNPSDAEIEEIVTHANGTWAPVKLDDAVIVGTACFTAPSHEPDQIHGYTMADVLAALDNPSTEYVLLELRLYNGLHKGTL